MVVQDSLGLCEELDAAMAAHVEGYADEWAQALADPQRLERFVSFVNAPDTPDPSIVRVPERGQVKPGPVLVIGPQLQVAR